MTLHLCRACSGPTTMVLDLGRCALSRRFLTPNLAHAVEPTAPLRLTRCGNCGLLQLDEIMALAAAEAGAAPADAAALAQQIVERYGMQRTDLVVEIGDGSYARAFRPFGVRAQSVVQPRHLETLEIGSARILLARDVLARSDPSTFLESVARVLNKDGIAVFDLPYVLPLFERLAYDEIRHETHFYFSVEGLGVLMARHGLEVIDAIAIGDDGGTIRVTVQRDRGPIFSRSAVEQSVAREQAAGINRPEAWSDFSQLVEHSRDLLTSEIEDWLYRGKRVAGWSRNGRGMTLLAYCGIDSRRLTCVIDEHPDLHGRLTPGHRIPIVAVDHAHRERPDLVLWLAGEWSPESSGRLTDFWARGGRILLPLPKPHYADPASALHMRRMADPRAADTIVPGLSFSDFA
jgi:C-methyltransferase C-terminal domain/Putative zinc binding domain